MGGEGRFVDGAAIMTNPFTRRRKMRQLRRMLRWPLFAGPHSGRWCWEDQSVANLNGFAECGTWWPELPKNCAGAYVWDN